MTTSMEGIDDIPVSEENGEILENGVEEAKLDDVDGDAKVNLKQNTEIKVDETEDTEKDVTEIPVNVLEDEQTDVNIKNEIAEDKPDQNDEAEGTANQDDLANEKASNQDEMVDASPSQDQEGTNEVEEGIEEKEKAEPLQEPAVEEEPEKDVEVDEVPEKEVEVDEEPEKESIGEQEPVQEPMVDQEPEQESVVDQVPEESVQNQDQQLDEELVEEGETKEELNEEKVNEPSEQDEEAFELKSPPAGRPRTPNQLDNQEVREISVEVAGEAEEIEGEAAVSKDTPYELRRASKTSIGSKASVPLTPKSEANGPIIQPDVNISSPVPASPATKSASGVSEGKQEDGSFEYDEISEVSSGSPRRGKKATFEDEGLLSPTKSKTRRRKKKGDVEQSEAEVEKVQNDEASNENEINEPVEHRSSIDEENERLKLQLQWDKQAAAEEGIEIPDRKKSLADQEDGITEKQEAEEAVPPPRPERSPSPIGRRQATTDYTPFDQDSHRETVPPRFPTDTSFSSWATADKTDYKPISPWVNSSRKYTNEYTVDEPLVPTNAYTAFFDDVVKTGPFASNLYATSRLLERSRSRTRERRNALRSQSTARNFYRYRFASQYPAPLRTRDYSMPAISTYNRAPSQAGSFISFMEYSGAKNYDLARSLSRGGSSLYNSNLALSRSMSRGGTDYYLGSGRMSRVDSYVSNLNSNYEWRVPSSYDIYHSRTNFGYSPSNGYIGDLQRSLSKERYERDRLRSKYIHVSHQLEQASRALELIRSYGSFGRSGSAPRTSVFANFYPHY